MNVTPKFSAILKLGHCLYMLYSILLIDMGNSVVKFNLNLKMFYIVASLVFSIILSQSSIIL